MVKPEDASREELLAHIAELHRLLAVAQATIERQDARIRELERRLGFGRAARDAGAEAACGQARTPKAPTQAAAAERCAAACHAG